jgi:hypothetical protein
MSRRTQIIGAVFDRYTAQAPECCLGVFTQTCQK